MSQRELPPKVWHPTEMLQVLESDPGDGKADPNAWLGQDEQGRTGLIHWWTPEILAYFQPLKDGEHVEFTWARNYGRAVISLAADGAWTVDRPPPPQVNVIYHGHDCFNATFEGLISTVLELHAIDCPPEPTWRPEQQTEAAWRKERQEWAEMEAPPPDRIPVTYIEAWGTETLVYRADPPRFETL